MSKTKVLTAHVPLPPAEKVDQLAAKLERSRGWIVKQALTAWVAQEEERNRLTREALANVDAGRVIDHQRFRRGLRVSVRASHCPFRADGAEVDWQGALRSGGCMRFWRR